MKIVDKKDETIVDSEEKTRHIGNHDVKIVDMKEVSISDVCLYSDQHDICAIFVFFLSNGPCFRERALEAH